MKTATLPAIRVEPELRDQLESVLSKGETLSSFIETTVRSAVEYRAVQKDFQARGLRSKERYETTGVSHSTDEVIDRLLAKTRLRREQVLGKGK